MKRAFAALAAAAFMLLAPIASAHEKGDEKKPDPPISMRIIAPSAKGPWLLRIDNEADRAMFIGADVRLLTFEVSAPLPPKKLGRGKTWDRSAKCSGPQAFGLDDHFPAGRELVLEPGQSYVEEFDPRLICFGKQANMLVPGAKVKPYIGWKPRARPSPRMETAPFMADDATRPRKYRPLRRLEGPTIVLSHGPPAVYGPEAPPEKPNEARSREGGAAKADDKAQERSVAGRSVEPTRTAKRSPKLERAQTAEQAAPAESPRGERGYGPGGTRETTTRDRGYGPGGTRENAAAMTTQKSGDRGYGPRGTREGSRASGEAKPKKEAGPPPKRRPRTAEEASEHRPKPSVPKPKQKPPPEDALAARLSLTTTHYSDASRPTDISLSVQAHNVGQRPLFVALRGRMLSFHIEGPDGPAECPRATTEHKVPRDLFRLMHHGTHVHMDVMLGEVCPAGTFDRPGLYLALPTLHANAEGKEYGLNAATGTATTRDPGKTADPKQMTGTHDVHDDATVVRIRQGRRPFYTTPPQAIPTRVLPGGARAKPAAEDSQEQPSAKDKNSETTGKKSVQ